MYMGSEYNRGSKIFLYGITDRIDVVICYSHTTATPGAVTYAAQKECQRFGKVAKFRGQKLNICPLLDPVAAIFDCLK